MGFEHEAIIPLLSSTVLLPSTFDFRAEERQFDARLCRVNDSHRVFMKYVVMLVVFNNDCGYKYNSVNRSLEGAGCRHAPDQSTKMTVINIHFTTNMISYHYLFVVFFIQRNFVFYFV